MGTIAQLTLPAGVTNVISINDTIVILDPATGLESKGIITDSGAYAASAIGGTQLINVQPFSDVDLFGAAPALGLTATGLKIFVYGSDYQKGQSMAGDFAAGGQNQARISVDPSFTQYSNSPLILRSQYVVNGSDMAQIGWVEVATEDGTGGYLWLSLIHI